MGAYFAGLRQGTGVYQYAGGTPGELTGIYMGDWVKGQMNGYGVLLYADGESYVGHWRLDKKVPSRPGAPPARFRCAGLPLLSLNASVSPLIKRVFPLTERVFL
jgi:hypothetical protein